MRIDPDFKKSCCDACTNHTGCRAWTVSVDDGFCDLVSSAGTAYPSLYGVSGYPLKSDPASYCAHDWDGMDGTKSWMDPDMGGGGEIECASIPPNQVGNAVADFPRKWRDDSGGRKGDRGTAWFFFPTPAHGAGRNLTGQWTSTGSDVYEITRAARPDTHAGFLGFSVACLDGGKTGDCDALNPGHNGSAWHSGNLTISADSASSRAALVHYDNLAVMNGSFDQGFTRLTWSDNSVWTRKQRKCRCKCKDRDCLHMHCNGRSMGQKTANELVRGKPWIVFVHGGVFSMYDSIGGNYAMLSSRVARAANMGVLGVDYRTTVAQRGGKFPAAIHDVVQALKWLRANGATQLYLYGDSSGGTQVVETLLWIEHEKLLGNDHKLNVSGAATFSAWPVQAPRPSSNPTQFPSTCWPVPFGVCGLNCGC